MSISVSSLRSGLHKKSFSYSTKKYPFRQEIESILGINLEDLHLYLGRFDKFQRSTDQCTLAHKVFYSTFASTLQPIYNSFVKEFIYPIVMTDFYYQVIPTFRIGLPGNRFVGEYHKDSKYNHQDYEINFNLGLANYEGNASLRTEDFPGSDNYISLECPYGRVFSFDHIDCMHGSEINDTNKTMVSFDFRLALAELYFDTDSSSVNMNSSFKPGSYFSVECVNNSSSHLH